MNLENIKVKDEKGNKVDVSVIGMFQVPELEKKYIMYSLIDEDETHENGGVLLGEVVVQDENVEILGILSSEKDMVLAYYNEISTQLGEDDNE